MRRLALVLFIVGVLSGCNNKPDIDKSTDSQLVAFPNPVTTRIEIYIPNQNSDDVTLQVFDPAGTMFFVQNFQAMTRIRVSVSLEDKPKGFYEVVLINGASITRQRLVKL